MILCSVGLLFSSLDILNWILTIWNVVSVILVILCSFGLLYSIFNRDFIRKLDILVISNICHWFLAIWDIICVIIMITFFMILSYLIFELNIMFGAWWSKFWIKIISVIFMIELHEFISCIIFFLLIDFVQFLLCFIVKFLNISCILLKVLIPFITNIFALFPCLSHCLYVT